MDLNELLADLDVIDQGGPGTDAPSGETAMDILEKGINLPGAPKAFVDRYASSKNRELTNNLAYVLVDLAENPTAETANLIYTFIERIPNWEYSRTVNLLLLTVRSQTVNGMAWDPPDNTPGVLSRFLLHCLGMESDDENDNADTASNILWNIQLWAEDRGGLRTVFNAEDRQAFRDKFDEVGLEPKPILEALGED